MREKVTRLAICIKCGKDVHWEDKQFWFGLEVPYINLVMHRECYDEIKDDPIPFLQENLEEYIKIQKNG